MYIDLWDNSSGRRTMINNKVELVMNGECAGNRPATGHHTIPSRVKLIHNTIAADTMTVLATVYAAVSVEGSRSSI